MARTPKVVEDRREQILDAAMRVFSQKGFAKATNKDVAREAGITPGLIYYYFESKESLLTNILEERSPIKLIRSFPPEVFALQPDVFLQMLVQRVLGIVESESIVLLLRMFLPEVIHNPETGQIIIGFFQRVLEFLGNYFKTKVEQGEFRQIDATMTAQVFFGGIMGFVLRRQILRDPTALAYTQEQIAEIIVETTLKGVLTR
jgi:AcrR family transcriptional regulator